MCLLLEWDLTLPWTSLMQLPISRTLTYPLAATGTTDSDPSPAHFSPIYLNALPFFPGSHGSAHLQGFIVNWMEQLDDKTIFNICRYNTSFPKIDTFPKNRHYSGGWFWLVSSTKAKHLFRELLIPCDPQALYGVWLTEVNLPFSSWMNPLLRLMYLYPPFMIPVDLQTCSYTA